MMSFISSLDTRALDIISLNRNLMGVDIFIGITEIGDIIFVGGLIAALVLYFALRRKYAYLAGLLVSVVSAAATTLALKVLIERARPDFAYQAYIESGFSFPSGHATVAMAFYGFCIFLVHRMVANALWRNLATLFLILLIVGIAFSRLYLGVHYLSDVLGGLVVGGVFALIGIALVKKFEQR